MVSSFALVAANVLMVNVYLKNVGQQEGTQYSTLETVLRICIDQFRHESPKTILFCLRDANPQFFNEAEYRLKLQNDVQKLWKDVWAGTRREEEFKKYEANSDRFFTLELAFLREYDRDYPEDFIEDVQKLRQRFIDPHNENYLFKKQNKEFNIPAADLPMLLENIWQTLLQNKELNLPNEKTQVANYRCEHISSEVIMAPRSLSTSTRKTSRKERPE
jgi:protein SEY1